MRPVNETVTDIEIIEDFSSTARCDEGFLRIRRLRCQNRRADGSASPIYRVDVVDRPRLDAVAVLVYRRSASGELEVLTRKNLRPAAYFRRGKEMVVPDPASYLLVEELVAGVMELEDKGEEGVRRRAVEEVREEAGFEVTPEEIRLLGGGFFVAPGIISEKVFPTAVDVTGKQAHPPQGDGSPLEEGTQLQWRPIQALLAACRSGEVPDAKLEIAITRLLAERA
ncbi:MAG TPA: NUDIX hydrolase [Myxococcaceae bacterium]|jgi:ADP-ribose pyrophosphatase